MLPKSARLTAAEVREVLKVGRSIRVGALSARYTKASGSAKAAAVVSTKVAKSAVVRNQLRRIGYKSLTPPPKGLYTVLFIHKKDVDPAEILTLCSKLSS